MLQAASQTEKTDFKIIEATLGLVGKFGFKGTTTREIAQEAGVNEVTIFRRFGSKESLVRASMSYLQQQLKKAFEEKKRDRTGDFRADLTNLVLSMMEILARRSEMVAALFSEAQREPYVLEVADSTLTFVLGIAREFLRGYRLDEGDVDSVTLSIVSFSFFRIVVRERVLERQFTAESRKKELESHVDLLISGITRKGMSSSSRGSRSRR
jgi:TetR/AcrR family transcriptional regulator